jgi:pimeloyl-ACP methyl ester carboxylesterase
MASVEANGITIEYETTGEGEPLLMVMGLGGQLTDWSDGFIDRFVAAGFQVITFDNRDQGLSTEFDWEPPTQTRAVLATLVKRPPKAGYLITDMANDAIGLLDALGIEQAHVVGMSMGGMIAQTIAIEHPQRVRSLTSIMSNTGDRKSGRIAPSIMPKLAKMPTPNRATAALGRHVCPLQRVPLRPVRASAPLPDQRRPVISACGHRPPDGGHHGESGPNTSAAQA